VKHSIDKDGVAVTECWLECEDDAVGPRIRILEPFMLTQTCFPDQDRTRCRSNETIPDKPMEEFALC